MNLFFAFVLLCLPSVNGVPGARCKRATHTQFTIQQAKRFGEHDGRGEEASKAKKKRKCCSTTTILDSVYVVHRAQRKVIRNLIKKYAECQVSVVRSPQLCSIEWNGT